MRVSIDENGKVTLHREIMIDALGQSFLGPEHSPEVVAEVQKAVDAIARGAYEEIDPSVLD